VGEDHVPEGMIVLDPFMGSGTTGMACLADGYCFFGAEMNEEFSKSQAPVYGTRIVIQTQFPSPNRQRTWLRTNFQIAQHRADATPRSLAVSRVI
jgi:hypothetical protein